MNLEEIKAAVLLILFLIVAYYSTQLNKKKKPKRPQIQEEEKIKENSIAKDVKALGIIIFTVLFIFALAKLYDENRRDAERAEYITHFKKNKELICNIGGQEKYLVSKQSGWSIKDEEHFLKDDRLIPIISCIKR